ncbi:GntR family transcriptional regulator [Bacillus atrophaeus]|uniref:GntR family transcriptional regulator n=1 Tax=Bacillus atrophaeus TaxID=1452 RepID=UPI002280D014|nr:GntR family transcriptional regulator [Bacillus atrophaeus]MCY8515911.1 GntR family transcriptional regulator [Bacillus atrophaeus]MCY8517204.1 GntR family transcriptional regulator [Bacillus atrophaeus]MCY8990082.1 GntR family transcriptional regulator [Bacillus atrophaeus]MCY9112737.1 GntR family transcriptional regulator [Bacillus atrophaeus]
MPSLNDKLPIFEQISKIIEDDILATVYKEGDQIISTTQISKVFQVNPATAVKGINLLVDQDILYKKRGIGMFVQNGAKARILQKRRQEFYDLFIVKLLNEAKKIELSNEDIISLIKGESSDNN